MRQAQKEYLRAELNAVQTAIESRSAQKLMDGLTEQLDDLMRDFVSHPSFSPQLRTSDEEQELDDITDYFFGRFFEQYAKGYILRMEELRKEIA